jgi:hypothetical protein
MLSLLDLLTLSSPFDSGTAGTLVVSWEDKKK